MVSIRPKPCRWCGKPIVFALTRTTARRAFDAATIKGFALSGDGRTLQARAAEIFVPHDCSERKSA
jgi:hypothetical protein